MSSCSSPEARTGWRSCRFLPRNRAVLCYFVKLAFSQPQNALKSSRRTPLETGLDLDERYTPVFSRIFRAGGPSARAVGPDCAQQLSDANVRQSGPGAVKERFQRAQNASV